MNHLFQRSGFRKGRVSSRRRSSSSPRCAPRGAGIEPLETRVLLTGDAFVTVLYDVNGNGVKDLEEPPMVGITVFADLDKDGLLGATEPSAVTDIDGECFITGLDKGNFEIREILPAGWAPTVGAVMQRIDIVNGEEAEVLFLNAPGSPYGSVAGTVWNDINGDGVRDASDAGIAGWTVFADLNTNKVLDAGEPSSVTDAAGGYTVTGLTTGQYKIREILPAGWDPTLGGDAAHSVEVIAGSTSISDFGNYSITSVGSIRGSVWNDINADGVRGGGDVGLSGWSVFLDLNSDGILTTGEPSAVTDAAGTYAFDSIFAGTYKVTEVLQAGWNASPSHPASRNITVIGGGSVSADFANYTPTLGSVSGRIWNDVNGDGLMGTEAGLAGWSVFVDQNADGLLSAGEPTATTDAAGNYVLSGLPMGSTVIREIPQVGWSATAPGTGMQLVVVQNASNITGINFGNKQRTDGAISGVAYFDANHNSIKDAGEKGLAGITVFIDANNNGVQDAGEASTVTSSDLFYTPGVDETGAYSFTHLGAGSYRVREILPAVLGATPTAAREQVIDLLPGEDRKNVNFADWFRPNEIHGLVFDDLNADHVRQAGESGLGGVTIYLDLDRDNVYDSGEPKTTTGADGGYAFTTDLTPGSYVLRELRHSGREHSYPMTTGGILWPTGVSNPAVGNVTPTSITTSLAKGQTQQSNVSITLPGSGALTNMVDVFLLFDDTGSFTANSPIVRAAFPQIISALQTAMPTVDFGFGVGRFEEYANFAAEYATGRPFVLNQPIVAASTTGFSLAIQSALDRTAPGYGGDQPETDIEALWQMATGRGFDGNNNGTTTDSGAAGKVSTQLTPGSSGDVPAFASFTVDPTGNVLPAAGTIGGAGFRAGALPIILVATDTGFAFQPAGETTITGINGLTLPISALTQTSRNTTPFSSGASIQQTITALNALGALVIGLGTNGGATVDPRQGLEALAKLTGATNRTLTTIANGTTDPIAPGDPFYFQISSGFAASVANGVVAAIQNGVSNVAVNITVRASDPTVSLGSTPGVVNNVGAGQTAAFNVTFTGDGRPHRFDLQFIRQGTDVVLGSIPVVIGTPIVGDGYEYEDLCDGEIAEFDDFGSWVNPLLPINVAPTFTKGADDSRLEDCGAVSVSSWATAISPGTATETEQLLDFDVSNDNHALFSVQPYLTPGGTLAYTPATGVAGRATISVRLHDTGGTVRGGADTSAAQTFSIVISPTAPLTVTSKFEPLTGETVILDFSSNVVASLTASSLQLQNLTTNTTAAVPALNYDAVLRRATVNLAAHSLPDGDYRLTIPAGALPGLATPHQLEFFLMAGDTNRDRTVNFFDLTSLAPNYGSSGRTWADGDFNGDGTVNFFDLTALAAGYGATLPALPTPLPSSPLIDAVTLTIPADSTVVTASVVQAEPAPVSSAAVTLNTATVISTPVAVQSVLNTQPAVIARPTTPVQGPSQLPKPARHSWPATKTRITQSSESLALHPPVTDSQAGPSRLRKVKSKPIFSASIPIRPAASAKPLTRRVAR